MVCEAQELGLTIPWDFVDFETISLVAELRREQRRLEDKERAKKNGR